MIVKVADVVFREDLYPRREQCLSTVEKYSENVCVLPPIVVNQDLVLIDGWHRWMAYITQCVEEISVVIVETTSDADHLEKATTMNAGHGLPLNWEEKREIARKIYKGTAEENRDQKQKDLESILTVSESTVRDWLSPLDDDTNEARNKQIFDLYMAFYTVEEIAVATSTSKSDVERIFPQIFNEVKLGDTNYWNASHASDFRTPIYDVRKQLTKSEGVSHYWNSRVRWIDTLLFLYTNPYDVVIDPFAGDGSTIDICRKRFRRCFASDREPIVGREYEIRRHDLRNGVLNPPQWKDVKLVFLDPPYWIQTEGSNNNDSEEMANQWLEDFTKNLAKVITKYSKRISNAYIALILRPTQWKATDRAFVDHIGDILNAVNLPVAMRYSVSYDPQQNTEMAESATADNTCPVSTQEIVVWRVDQKNKPMDRHLQLKISVNNPNSDFAKWLRDDEELGAYVIERGSDEIMF